MAGIRDIVDFSLARTLHRRKAGQPKSSSLPCSLLAIAVVEVFVNFIRSTVPISDVEDLSILPYSAGK